MKFLNLGFLAHVDAGKTTTVEQMLFLSGKVRKAGSVDRGNTQTDHRQIERERGISVFSSSASLEWEGFHINVIDTPGHMDFTGEAERALAALDAAVLIVSCAEGIQSQTERFWKALKEIKIPALIYVNKIDRAGAEPERIYPSLKQEFSEYIIKESSFSEEDIASLCELDEKYTDIYLSGTKLSENDCKAFLREQTLKCRAWPLLFGCSASGFGVKELLDACAAYLPFCELKREGEPSGIIYKIEHDKALGKIAHIRMFEGVLHNRDALTLSEGEYKITQIRRVQGARYEDSGILYGGDIAAVCGLTGAKPGDIFGNAPDYKSTGACPLFTVQVTTEDGKISELLKAVGELADEDPLMKMEYNQEEKEIHIRIMGSVQLEVLTYLLKERYNLNAVFSTPSVIYKETPLKEGIGFEAYTMPKPCWAVVKLHIEPLERGKGLIYNSVVKEGRLWGRYQEHIAASVPEALKQGLLGWEVTDLKVTLIDGENHHIHTHPLDFFLATPIAVMKALDNSGVQLLEPMSHLRLTVDDSIAGKIMSDIITSRGRFDSPVSHNGKTTIDAIVPVATTMDYGVRFAAMTSGKGIILSDFSGYEPCPLELGKITKRRGVNPLDRDKWILHKRGAIS